MIYGNDMVYGHTKVYKHTQVYGKDWVCSHIQPWDNDLVSGNE